jgi:glycosyltransferase involved in cell wall biosynthesis
MNQSIESSEFLHPNIFVLHPELRLKHQRGIYLYAKSLVSALKSAGYRGYLVSDFSLNDLSNGIREIYSLIDCPPSEKIRSVQMLPRYVLQYLGLHPHLDQFSSDLNIPVLEKSDFVRDLVGVVNAEYFYEICRLAASKRFLSPVDVDFFSHSGAGVAITTAPLAIKSKSRRMKIIQTVHDLIVLNTTVHEANVEKFKRRLEGALFGADLIMAVSEYTKLEILDRYPEMEDRVRVVYQPIPANAQTVLESESSLARQAVLNRFELQSGEFVFYIGAIEERKNIARLIRAYLSSTLAKTIPLVLAGSVDSAYIESEGLSRYFDSKNESGVRYIGRVTELEKLCLLREARLFAFPSITEGFGIPVLEAQSMRCAVLTTNASAIPEVVGDSAVLINDPTDVDELVHALESAVFDSDLNLRLKSAGFANSARFSKSTFSQQLGELIKLVS